MAHAKNYQFAFYTATDDDDYVTTKTMATGTTTYTSFTNTSNPWVGKLHLEQNNTSDLTVELTYINGAGSQTVDVITVPASSVVTYTTEAVSVLKQIYIPTPANTKVLKLGYDTKYYWYDPDFNGEQDDIAQMNLLNAAGTLTPLTVGTTGGWDATSKCFWVASSSLTAGDLVLVNVDYQR